MKVLFLVHDCLTVPLGVSYLAALSRDKGHCVKALSLTGGSIEQEIGEFDPDVIGFGSTTGFHRQYLKLVKPIRETLGIPVIMGGAHPTFFPEVMDENPWLDFAMRGEADHSFPLFLDALEGKMLLEDVGNLIYRKSGEIVHNPILPLVKDLDSIPVRFLGYQIPDGVI
ncbi:MAG: cobalamin-dependent protein [Candidatus Sabulitectum sp.]|nr:cobalamin-dependent protein [Candidatus Sabulitectum sp.]